jgi:IclR family transcriptional regulator, acetate operon repressor
MDVKSAGRTVDLFEAFARSRGPLSLSELARALAMPHSSCFNLVRALEGRGYLYSVGERRRLYPTRRLYHVASAIVAAEPVVARAEPVLMELRDATQETVLLGKRQGERALYLAVIEGPQTVRYTAQVGATKPLHSSAIGKALLSALAPPERAEIVARLPLEAMTGATITEPSLLLVDLEKSAGRGYAQTRGENIADVSAIAKAVRIDGLLYAIAVAGPMHRMAAEIPSHLAALEKACFSLGEGR